MKLHMEIPLTVEVLGRTLHLIVQTPLNPNVPLRDQVPDRNLLVYVTRPEEGQLFDLRADLELPTEFSCLDEELQGPVWRLELRFESACIEGQHHELNLAALGLLSRLDEDLTRLIRLRGFLRATHQMSQAIRASLASALHHSKVFSDSFINSGPTF